MKIEKNPVLMMHIATLLWGLTAILGKLVSVNGFMLVWYRTLFVCLLLLFYSKLIPELKRLSRRDYLIMFGIGSVLALHWIAWYTSVKIANASIALSCIALVSFFIAFIEPLFLKKTFQLKNILLGLLVIPGILLINNGLHISLKKGFFVGILAAFLAAIYAVLNKKYTQHINSNIITFVELLGGFIFMTVTLPIYLKLNWGKFEYLTAFDFLLMLIMTVFCTLLSYYLYFTALKATNAFKTSLINNLEPVYGILLSILILHENKHLNAQFYIGTAILVAVVFADGLMKEKSTKLR